MRRGSLRALHELLDEDFWLLVLEIDSLCDKKLSLAAV